MIVTNKCKKVYLSTMRFVPVSLPTIICHVLMQFLRMLVVFVFRLFPTTELVKNVMVFLLWIYDDVFASIEYHYVLHIKYSSLEENHMHHFWSCIIQDLQFWTIKAYLCHDSKKKLPSLESKENKTITQKSTEYV